jgi:HK97 gp10 family phage protein
MIKLSIPQSEINKAVKEMEGRASTYERNVAKELFKGALDIESGAKQRAPVITNTLRSSIQSKIDHKDISAEVIVNAEYGAYVEFGTGRYAMSEHDVQYSAMAQQFKGKGIKQINRFPKPYLIPAYEEQRPKIIARVKKAKI